MGAAAEAEAEADADADADAGADAGAAAVAEAGAAAVAEAGADAVAAALLVVGFAGTCDERPSEPELGSSRQPARTKDEVSAKPRAARRSEGGAMVGHFMRRVAAAAIRPGALIGLRNFSARARGVVRWPDA